MGLKVEGNLRVRSSSTSRRPQRESERSSESTRSRDARPQRLLHAEGPLRAARDRLLAACRRYLAGEPGTVFFACGTVEPELAREVNERDFDVALHVVFDSSSHDAYQSASAFEVHRGEPRQLGKGPVFDSIVDDMKTEQSE